MIVVFRLKIESSMELPLEGRTADKHCSVSEDGRPPLKRFKGVQLKGKSRRPYWAFLLKTSHFIRLLNSILMHTRDE